MSLITAIEAADVTEVQRLLEAGADPNQRADWGDPALVVAVSEGHLSIVDLLLKAGADAGWVDEASGSVLHAGPRHPELLELLLDAGAPVNARDDRGATALYLLVSEPDLVEILLERGADPNLATLRHETPLTFCAAWGHLESARRLLAAGADANYVDPETGYSVLCYAAESGETAVAEALLDSGADPDRGEGPERTALWLALKREHLDMALLLADSSSAKTRRAVAALTATLHDKVARLMRALNG